MSREKWRSRWEKSPKTCGPAVRNPLEKVDLTIANYSRIRYNKWECGFLWNEGAFGHETYL